MKTILTLLLSFIVSAAPCLAMHGYTLGGTQGVTGAYGGVLIPTAVSAPDAGGPTTDFGANAIGLFTLSVPYGAIGAGQVYIYSPAGAMNGTILALPDPNTAGGIIGIVTAAGEVYINAPAVQVTAEAEGNLTATVNDSGDYNSSGATNLAGAAYLNIAAGVTGRDGVTNMIPTESITFAIEGFQQSGFATQINGI